MQLLPPDVWGLIGAHLAVADVRALALACPRLLPEIRRIIGTRSVTVSHGLCEGVLAHWHQHLTDLQVRGLSPLLCIRNPLAPLRLPGMPLLRRLALVEPRYPPGGGFWRGVFEACPLLEDVDVECRWVRQQDVGHAADLVVHGAPRLRRLRVVGGRGTGALHPAVHSSTLREYVAMCPEAPVPVVCARMDALETYGCLLARLLPPGASVRRAVVREVDDDMEALRSLPADLEELQLQVDGRPIDREPYGAPLAHVTGLRDLDLRMQVVPVGQCALDLLGNWLGAGPAIRRVRATFREPATYWLEQAMDDLEGEEDSEEFAEVLALWHEAAKLVPADGLRRWMDRHPDARVRITNFGTLLAVV